MYKKSTTPTDLNKKFKNFATGMGLHLGYSGFSHDQNNRDSSGAYFTCIYFGLNVKINMRRMLHGMQH